MQCKGLSASLNGRKHLLECNKQALIVITTFLPPLTVYLGLKEKNKLNRRKQALRGIILLPQYTIAYSCLLLHKSFTMNRLQLINYIGMACHHKCIIIHSVCTCCFSTMRPILVHMYITLHQKFGCEYIPSRAREV